MESIFGMILSFFPFHFLTILLLILVFFVVVLCKVKLVFNKRKLNERLLEIAFERGLMQEKSRLVQNEM